MKGRYVDGQRNQMVLFMVITAYEISACIVGSERCIRDRFWHDLGHRMGYADLFSWQTIEDLFVIHI